MKPNEVLFWLSARRAGSWQQFRAAVEELHCTDEDSGSNGTTADDAFPLHQRLRLDLERLGHVEFFAQNCADGWRVCPPTLAAHRTRYGVRAMLCGARSPALRERVVSAAVGTASEILPLAEVPEPIRIVAAGIEPLEDLASRAGLRLQPDAPLAILSQLPSCDPPLPSHRQAELPLGADWRIRRFDSRTLQWRKTERRQVLDSRTGFFEFQLYQQWRYFLRWSGGTFEAPRGVGLYVFLCRRRKHVLHYDAAARTLSLPRACRPPRLIERALVLCSGLPPGQDQPERLVYSDVPPEISRFAARLLYQPLV